MALGRLYSAIVRGPVYSACSVGVITRPVSING